MRYLNLDMDTTLGGNNPSDEKISSQRAIKVYIDNSVKTNVSEMNDVAINNVSNGQILFYDSSLGKWINKDVDPTTVFRDWRN